MNNWKKSYYSTEISQFHLKSTPGPGNQQVVTKEPRWSLGIYNHTIAVRERRVDGQYPKGRAPIVKLVDFFEGGQRCDENNRPRRTQVHIQCCPERESPEMVLTAALVGINEPNICEYEAIVCSSLLCELNDNTQSRTPAKVSDKFLVLLKCVVHITPMYSDHY
jgi:hypothetical protein